MRIHRHQICVGCGIWYYGAVAATQVPHHSRNTVQILWILSHRFGKRSKPLKQKSEHGQTKQHCWSVSKVSSSGCECKMLNIKQKCHIPYRPQTCWMVEPVNRTIKELLAKQVAQHKSQWTDALPTVLTMLWATPSKVTGISPYELITWRVMKLPIDPEISPADLGPLTVAKQQTVLTQMLDT